MKRIMKVKNGVIHKRIISQFDATLYTHACGDGSNYNDDTFACCHPTKFNCPKCKGEGRTMATKKKTKKKTVKK